MTSPTTPVILCVDDEPAVLDGIGLTLRRRFTVLTATSGTAALELLKQHQDHIAIVMSDMRMPGMDGATLLTQVRATWPDAVRVLLTGHADVSSAVAAVNEGQIFRFLTKPCAPQTLLAALDAAIEHRRLITAERVLLEHTLQGSINALVEVLALANPAAFGHATRVKALASKVLETLGITQRWQVEVAAMLLPLGGMTIPAEVSGRAAAGGPLTLTEKAMLDRVPLVSEHLLQNIPRLEVVRELLLGVAKSPTLSAVTGVPASSRALADIGAHVLRAAHEVIDLEMQGHTARSANATVRTRTGRHDAEVLRALERLAEAASGDDEVRELPLASLRVGMYFAEDVRMKSGMLLVAKGSEITLAFLEHIKNFSRDSLGDRFRVLVRASAAAA